MNDLRQLVEAAHDRTRPDRDLLERCNQGLTISKKAATENKELSAQRVVGEAALSEIVRRYSPVVRRACSRYLRDGDIDDASQATFVVLAKRIVQGRWGEFADRLPGWLHGVAAKVALNLAVQLAKRKKRELLGQDLGSVQERAGDAIEWAVEEALSRLSEEVRAVAVLKIEECKEEQIAKQLGVTVACVKNRWRRAKQVLIQYLTDRGVRLPLSVILAAVGTLSCAGVSAELISITKRLAFAFGSGDRASALAMNAVAVRLAEAALQGSFSKIVGTMLAVAFLGMAVTAGTMDSRTLPAPPAAPPPTLVASVEVKPAALSPAPEPRPVIQFALDNSRVLVPNENAYCTAFSPDGSQIAVGKYKGQVFWVAIWPALGGVPLRQFPLVDLDTTTNTGVRCLAYSPGGRYLVAGLRSGKIHVWDLQAGPDAQSVLLQAQGKGDKGWISSLAFDPLSSSGFVSTSNQLLKFWVRDGTEWHLACEMRFDTALSDVAFLPGGKRLLVGSREWLRMYDASAIRREGPLPAPIIDIAGDHRKLALSKDGRWLVCNRGQDLVVFEVGENQLVEKQVLRDPKTGVAHLDEIRGVAIRDDGLIASGGADQKLRLWNRHDRHTGELKATIHIGGEGNVHVSFSPDGKQLVVCAEDKVIAYDLTGAVERGAVEAK